MKPTSLLILIVLALPTCGGENASTGGGLDTSAAAASQPREIHFVARDFEFDGPTTIEGGLVTLSLSNESETWHHLQLIRLPDGLSMQEFEQGMAQMQPGTPPPTWLVEAGGVNPPPPGGSARVTTWIEPGEYAVVCVVDTPDHVPHVAKGMMRSLTVTAPTGETPPEPSSDLTLTLVDYAFAFSAPPTRGSHVIRVEDTAEQAHELALFRFAPGKTMDDLMAWAETYHGPAPIIAAGGVPAFRRGQTAYVEVTFEPGDYVALCFVPDAGDGLPHIVHGMALPFHIA